MILEPTKIPDVVLVKPGRFEDHRGTVLGIRLGTSWGGIGIPKVWDISLVTTSRKGAVRGLHYQDARPQGKLIRCTRGAIFDVAVDIRPESPTFGRHVEVALCDNDGNSLWIPPGFAHGFQALTDKAEVSYLVSGAREPERERAIRWDDVDLRIAWPIIDGVTLSERDGGAEGWREAECQLR